MTKILNFALKIKEGGRKGGTGEVLRPCHPQKKKLNRALNDTFASLLCVSVGHALKPVFH